MTTHMTPVDKNVKSQGMPRLSIIMPAYNEARRISANLHQVCNTFSGHDFEIVVVDDGSQDNTLSESQSVVAEGLPVRVVRLDVNRGKGAALCEGFKEASGDLIVFLDSDLEISPSHILELWSVMRVSGADVVIGTKGRLPSGFPVTRRILSNFFRAAVSFMFGLSLSDTQTGIKLFRRDVLELAVPRLTVSRFAFDIELLVAAIRMGYRVLECPVTTSYQRTGQMGRIGIGQLLHMMLDTLLIYYRASFWRWLQPGWMTRFWMVLFVISVLVLGIGIGKIVTPLVLSPPIRQVFYIVALQFLPPVVRDWLLVIAGGGMLIVSLVQLNKSLLDAFARRDRGGLAGIWQKR